MNLLSDGWLVVHRDLPAVLSFAGLMLWGALVAAGTLNQARARLLDVAQIISLAAGGWVLAALAASLLVAALAVMLRAWPPGAVVFGLLGIALVWAIYSLIHPAVLPHARSWIAVLFFGLTGICLAVVRLAFVVHLSLPLYFDSPVHFQIIRDLTAALSGLPSPASPAWAVTGYYHLGYHVLMAVVAHVTKVDMARLMLVSGQLVLASVPLSLYFIACRISGSMLAGVFAVALGAFGWYMPAHALNWGKYPALFSLPAVLFTVNVAYLAASHRHDTLALRRLFLITAAGLLASAFLHTRAPILLGIALMAALLGRWLMTQRAPSPPISLGAAIAVLLVEVILLAREPILSSVLDPYLGSGLGITILVGVLAIPAFIAYPGLVIAAVLSLCLLLAGLFIPVPVLSSTSLLDRPLVEMVLFIPLSLVGAVGLGSAVQRLLGTRPPWRTGATALLSVAVIVFAFRTYDFYPSSCCSLSDESDRLALEWIGGSLPADAHLAIASTTVAYAPPPYPALVVPGDAGAWITPLTGRVTSTWDYSTDFRAEAVHRALCMAGVTEIYLDTGSESFDGGGLDVVPEWYRIILSVPGAAIYQLMGC